MRPLTFIAILCAVATLSDRLYADQSTPTEAAPSQQSQSSTGGTSTAQPSLPPKLEGALGIKWGDSRERVKEILSVGHPLSSDDSGNKDELFFDGGKVAGEDVWFIGVTFYHDQAARILIAFSEQKEDDVFDQYRRLKSLLVSKYGKPNFDVRKFKSPFTEGDGYEVTALRTKKLNQYTVWYLPVAKGSDITNDVYLCAKDNMINAIDYSSGDLCALIDAAEKKKNTDQL
jgi:hypothetical protein